MPKTGGSTLNWILKHQYAPAEFQLLIRHFTSLDVPAAAWRDLPADRSRSLRMVSAHMSVGLHSVIERPSRYITILREPVARVVSAYYHMRRSPRHPLHEEALRGSLEDFVRSGVFLDSDNGQVRRLSGVGERGGVGACDRSTLELARQNVDELFEFVGVTDLFDESLLLLRGALGWSMPAYLYQNRGSNRPPRDELSEVALRVIRDHNQLDAELYEYARDAVVGSVSSGGSAFQRELARFRTLNRTWYRGVFFPERLVGKIRAERRRWRRRRRRGSSPATSRT